MSASTSRGAVFWESPSPVRASVSTTDRKLAISSSSRVIAQRRCRMKTPKLMPATAAVARNCASTSIGSRKVIESPSGEPIRKNPVRCWPIVFAGLSCIAVRQHVRGCQTANSGKRKLSSSLAGTRRVRMVYGLVKGQFLALNLQPHRRFFWVISYVDGLSIDDAGE